jgi:hypothetical protein
VGLASLAVGHAAGQLDRSPAQRPKQLTERPRLLQLAQPWGVRRAHVHHQEIGEPRQPLETVQVILRCLGERGDLALADVDPQDRLDARTAEARRRGIRTGVVEAEAVEERAVGREAEETRARVPRLRPGGHRPDLDEPEAECRERVEEPTLLVEPRRKADWIGEFDPPPLHAQRLRFHGELTTYGRADRLGCECHLKAGGGELVDGLWR